MSGEHDVVTPAPGQPAEPSRPSAPGPRSGAARRRLVPPGVVAPALAALLCVALTVLVWRLFVTTTRGQQVEEAARIGSVATRESLFAVTDFVLGVVSVPSVALVVGGAVAVSLLQRRWSIAVAAIVVVCGANLTTQVLQDLLERPAEDASAIVLNSFPSGHATVGASVAAAGLLVAPVRWRPAVALVGALLSAVMGMSTIIGNEIGAWHRGSDVVAAMLVAAAWYFAVEAVLAGVTRDDGSPRSGGNASPARVRVPLRILYAVGGLCAGLGGGALLATTVRAPIETGAGQQVAFWGSLLGVAAVACFTIGLMLRLRPHHPPPARRPDEGQVPST